MDRRIDDMSSASLSIGHFVGPRQRDFVPPPPLTEDCIGVLENLDPWVHELAFWRDDDLAWVGPVIKSTWHANDIQIDARDLFQWFERRLLERDREYFGVDLADQFLGIASDAMHRDPSPHVHMSPLATGIIGDRTILADAKLRAADQMRELLRAGLDMTMVGRTMVIGGTEIPTADLGILTTDHFDNVELVGDGLNTETESHVVGSSTDSILGPVSAVSGAPIIDGVRTVDPDRGLVQNVVTESGIEDEAQAQAAADSRRDLLSETPRSFSARLLPSAPISFSDLIPGAAADLRVELLAKQVIGEYRLQTVPVRVDQNGNETVGVVFTNLGTTQEA